MTIKDLLQSTASCEVAATLAELCSVDESEKDTVLAAYEEFICSLTSIDPIDTGHTLLGCWLQSDGREQFDVPLYRRSDLELWKSETSVLSGLTSIEDLTEVEIEDLAQRPNSPESYAFELAAWNEVLGYEIVPQNAADVGPVLLCAQVLYEMTFFGFSEDEVKAERAKLDEALAESEEIMRLPEDEREKHLKSAEEAFANLGITDTRSDEEKQEQHRKLAQEIVTNKIRKERMLEKYL